MQSSFWQAIAQRIVFAPVGVRVKEEPIARLRDPANKNPFQQVQSVNRGWRGRPAISYHNFKVTGNKVGVLAALRLFAEILKALQLVGHKIHQLRNPCGMLLL